MFRNQIGLRNSDQTAQFKERWATAFCVAWAAIVALLTLWPATDVTETTRRINTTSPLDFGANILLFVPIFVVVGARTARWLAPLGAAALGTIAIETLQAFLPGRDPSIFDVVANCLGAALALVAVRTVRQLVPNAHARALLLLVSVSALAIGSVVCDVYGSQYATTRPPFFLQLQPRMNWVAQTEWRVVAHDFSGVHPPDGILPVASEFIARRRCGGGNMTATLIPRGSRTSGWAPVIRISDLDGASFMALADWRGRLFLTSNTRATSRGADMAWYAIDPSRKTRTANDTLRIAVECDDRVMSWRVWQDGVETSGSTDLRFGYTVRTFTSSLLASIDGRLLLVPLLVFWSFIGLACGRLARVALSAKRSWGARALITLITLLPGITAAVIARADTRMAWVAWALGCAISIVIYKASNRTSDSLSRE